MWGSEARRKEGTKNRIKWSAVAHLSRQAVCSACCSQYPDNASLDRTQVSKMWAERNGRKHLNNEGSFGCSEVLSPAVNLSASQRKNRVSPLCCCFLSTYEGVSKSFRTDHLERELKMVQVSATRCSCIAILWVSLMSFIAMTLCVAS